MGYTLTPIPFIDIDTKIKEVISASDVNFFKAKSLRRFAKYRGSTSYKDDNKNHLFFEFLKDGKREFIEFISK